MKNKNINKNPRFKKISKININIQKQLLRLLVVLVVGCSVSFIACVNDIAIKGFVIKDLKVKLSELTEKNKQQELKVHDLKSLDNISMRAQELKMVKVDKIDYITIIDGSVALSD